MTSSISSNRTIIASREDPLIATSTVDGAKKVTFSVPEVSSVQLPPEFPEHEGGTPLSLRKSTPKKKRHCLADDVKDKAPNKVKRRKVKEVNSVKDGIKHSFKDKSVSGKA